MTAKRWAVPGTTGDKMDGHDRDKILDKGRVMELGFLSYDDYTDLLLSSVPEMDPDWLDGVLVDRKRKGVKSADFIQS